MKSRFPPAQVASVACAILGLLCPTPQSAAAADTRPNIVFIIVDDLNDAISDWGGIPAAPTPNIDRLGAMGVSFRNAHVNNPICLPSRNSFLSGAHPARLGHYRINDDVRAIPLLEHVVYLPQLMRRHGYFTAGAGKVFHGGQKFHGGDGTQAWDEFHGDSVLYGPFPPTPEGRRFPPVHPRQESWVSAEQERELVARHSDPFWVLDGMLKFGMENGVAPIEDVPAGGWFHQFPDRPYRFVSPDDREALPDEDTAMYAEHFLARRHDRPFFLALGFIRPHTPLFAPAEFFEQFPPDKIRLPPVLADDLDDCAPAHVNHRPYGRLRYEFVISPGERGWRETLQGYLASIAFMDAQLGRVLDVVEKTPSERPTAIVFASDHGYHMGEKKSWFKDTLWEEATRVPLIICAPGTAQAGTRSDAAVSMIDVYPTILELCGITDGPYSGGVSKDTDAGVVALDGESLVPLLRDPASGNERAIVTSVRGLTGIHHALRTKDFRYILCEDGSEELYDHRRDPHEHTNLASEAALAETKAALRRQLEEKLAAYNFHPAKQTPQP